MCSIKYETCSEQDFCSKAKKKNFFFFIMTSFSNKTSTGFSDKPIILKLKLYRSKNKKEIDPNYLIISDIAIPQINQMFVLAITTWTGYLFLVDANQVVQTGENSLPVFLEYPPLPETASTIFQTSSNLEYHDPLTAVCIENSHDLTVYYGDILGKVYSYSPTSKTPTNIFTCGGPIVSLLYNDALFALSLDGKIHILRNDIYHRLILPDYTKELPVAFDVRDQNFLYVSKTKAYYSENIEQSVFNVTENMIDKEFPNIKQTLEIEDSEFTCTLHGAKTIYFGTSKGLIFDQAKKLVLSPETTISLQGSTAKSSANVGRVNSIVAKDTIYVGSDLPYLVFQDKATKSYKYYELDLKKQDTNITKLVVSNDTTDDTIKLFAVSGYDWTADTNHPAGLNARQGIAASSNIVFIRRVNKK